ncbi:MAG: SirB1 family protein [Actinomycetota bacterium]
MNPVEQFRALVSQPQEQIDLGRAALLLGAADHPRCDVQACMQMLDELAYGVDDLAGLRRRLFQEHGFTGETDRYYDPDSSFLDVVLERKRGIPIALSVITMEVGRRAGVPLEGIGMPGHFLVRSAPAGQYIDPFFRGEILDEAGIEARFRQVTGVRGSVAFAPGMRPVAGKLEILARMLNNLRAIYRAQKIGGSLEWVVRMRLAIPTVPRQEVAELGEALAMQGRVAEAVAEIEAVAMANPELAPALAAAALKLRATLN